MDLRGDTMNLYPSQMSEGMIKIVLDLTFLKVHQTLTFAWMQLARNLQKMEHAQRLARVYHTALGCQNYAEWNIWEQCYVTCVLKAKICYEMLSLLNSLKLPKAIVL